MVWEFINSLHKVLRALDWPGRTTLQQDPSAHVYWERLIAEAKRDPKPRTGAAYIGLGEACLTPGLVMHGLCLPPHLHAYIWLVNLSLIWLINLSLIWLVNSQNLILAKNFTAYVCVMASGSQCHPATAHVASHKSQSRTPDVLLWPWHMWLNIHK